MNYFDLHCDTVSKKFDHPESECHVNKDLSAHFEIYKQCFALFISDKYKKSDALKRATDLYNSFLNENKSGGAFCGIKSFLTLENCESFGGDLKNIEVWRKRGAVMGTLTWNGENGLGFGSSCNDGGLTAFGKLAVKEMEKNKIIVDVSHLNEDGFCDVCKRAKRPFVASHSNCFSVCPHPRNLKDYQLKEIINCGGLTGICYYSLFLGNGNVFERIYEHICHIISLGGEKSIAFGSDFDGAKMKRRIKNLGKVPDLYSYLKKKGFDEELLENIFFKNAENFFKNVLQQ